MSVTVIVEKWATPEALRSHGSSDAVHELRAAYAGKLARESDIQVLRPQPATPRSPPVLTLPPAPSRALSL